MIPVDEGNEQCITCGYFYYAYGCMPTYDDIKPPCGREVITSNKDHQNDGKNVCKNN